MPASSSITKICGIGTLAAMEISSTTLRSRRSEGSVVSDATGTAPMERATSAPPPRSIATRTRLETPITTGASTVISSTSSGLPSTSQTIRSSTTTMPTVASANSATRRREEVRARC